MGFRSGALDLQVKELFDGTIALHYLAATLDTMSKVRFSVAAERTMVERE
jgi:hypothetical protein